ncbi:MAG TPA: 5-oxoprolinase subunit PxpB [Opitutaceae bacterium]|nr:5-oxoprolinase subunit PxpB [Opitutaceae bacterium]
MSSAFHGFHCTPLGDRALIISFGREISPTIHERVRAFSAALTKHPILGVIEIVPAYTTVTVHYEPLSFLDEEKTPYDLLKAALKKTPVNEDATERPREIKIPVCYGGEYGPDLADVAKHTQLDPEEVIARHHQATYTVYLLGFLPGFPYLGGLDPQLATPRRATPRLRVPLGSVAIGGEQTGVYPLESPGGWNIIGRTPLRLFDPSQVPPALLQPGDLIRFSPITSDEMART